MKHTHTHTQTLMTHTHTHTYDRNIQTHTDDTHTHTPIGTTHTQNSCGRETDQRLKLTTIRQKKNVLDWNKASHLAYKWKNKFKVFATLVKIMTFVVL